MPRIVLFAAVLLSLGCFARAQEEAEKPAYQQPVLIRVQGVIGPRLEHYLLRKLQRAKASGCDLLIVEIDSPGGGLEETLKLCDELISLQGVHTVAYIPREALSGAALLALACDDIIMSDMARIGDCGPIYMAEDFLFRHAPEKIRSDLVAQVRAICQQKGHPEALAEAMVDHNVKVERVRSPEGGAKGDGVDGNKEQFLTDRELASRPELAQWAKLETLPESGGGRFLELLGKRAKELGLATANLDTREKVYEHYGLTQPPLILKPNTVDITVFVLNHWLVTGLILLVGLVALMYEFSAPGVGIGGLTAGLCFALFFWARFLGGTSGWLEVLLFGAGIVFLAVELFVLPGFGITGVTGILLMLASIVLASQEFALPTTNSELTTMTTSTLTALLAGSVGFVVCALTLRHMEAIPVLNRLMLKPPVVDTSGVEAKTEHGKPWPAEPAVPIAVGDWGVAATPLRPGGKAQFGDHVIDVVSEGAFLQAGVQLRIVEMQGTRIIVEPAVRA